PGSRPCWPVRYCDHGSCGEGQIASAVGRTWEITAFTPSSRARSIQVSNSSCCASASRPGSAGQSMFSTTEIHMAPNWRAEGWGTSGPASPRPSADAGTGPRERAAAAAEAAGSSGPPSPRPAAQAGTGARVTAKAAVVTAAAEDRRKKERRSTVLTRRGLLLGDRGPHTTAGNIQWQASHTGTGAPPPTISSCGRRSAPALTVLGLVDDLEDLAAEYLLDDLAPVAGGDDGVLIVARGASGGVGVGRRRLRLRRGARPEAPAGVA